MKQGLDRPLRATPAPSDSFSGGNCDFCQLAGIRNDVRKRKDVFEEDVYPMNEAQASGEASSAI